MVSCLYGAWDISSHLTGHFLIRRRLGTGATFTRFSDANAAAAVKRDRIQNRKEAAAASAGRGSGGGGELLPLRKLQRRHLRRNKVRVNSI